MNNAFDTLEIVKIIERISRYTTTALGKKKLESSVSFLAEDELKRELSAMRSYFSMIDEHGYFPVYEDFSLSEAIDKLRKGEVLEGDVLSSFTVHFKCVVELLNYFSKVENTEDDLAPQLFFDKKLYDDLSRSISSEGEVKDEASRSLHELREKLKKFDKKVRQKAVEVANKNREYLSSINLAMREGHYSLAVSATYKSYIEGLVLDVSDSGQTIFIEPREVLEMENEKRILEIEERNEVSRILREFSATLFAHSVQLERNEDIFARLDILSAKHRYMLEIDGSIPNLSQTRKIELYSARHPLIAKDNVVANDFVLDSEKTMMLISGPNAGGKTIALKTVASLIYMSNLALPIPAVSSSEIGYFENIYVDIGDSQSIENNLSTFSAHINAISAILKCITSKDLVFIDELGEGTDPREGESLAIAIASELLKRNVYTFITSHFDLLKRFGMSRKEVLNASFVFDESEVTPTYKMVIGTCGSSYGLSIARKYGLPNEVIEEAKKIYDTNYKDDLNARLEELDKERKELAKKMLANDELKANLLEKKKQVDQKSDELAKKEISLKEKKLASLDDYLNKTYDDINSIYAEFKADKDIDKAFTKLDEVKLPSSEKKEEVNIGDRVVLERLGIEGSLVSLDKNKAIVVTNNGLKVNAKKNELRKLYTPSEKKNISTRDLDKEIMTRKSVSSSLNLIGKHVDEALDELDKYLDDCSLSHLKVVRIIHGYGSGRLRQAIQSHLKKVPYVESFKLGDELDGGGGATIVTLK